MVKKYRIEYLPIAQKDLIEIMEMNLFLNSKTSLLWDKYPETIDYSILITACL